MKDKNSFAHTQWRCKYHLVFAQNIEDKLYMENIKSIGEIIRKLCERKNVEIHEANACKDHIHMLVSIPLYHKKVILDETVLILDMLNLILKIEK
ncbi:MAG TPA: transposase [Virgibacillus sp.]|nr:transposase [Virgibacillus sp.]HLR69601.1 transposase [Virgibacillus sp.]